jgi:hypothetical protein
MIERPTAGETELAFSYLYPFRRIVVVLALLGAGIAWAEQWTGLFAAFVCIGIGELIECSYYLGILKWSATVQSTRSSAKQVMPTFQGG